MDTDFMHTSLILNYKERRELLDLLKDHPEWVDKINKTQEYIGVILPEGAFDKPELAPNTNYE